MRTSNKILLGGFVATILIITGIHAVLYAKIKNGDLVDYREEQLERMEKTVLGNIKHVTITGLEECHIVPADTAILEVPVKWKNNFQYRITADSLVIDAGLEQREYVQGARKFAPIVLYLPPVESISTDFAIVHVRGAIDSAHAISRNIVVANSELNIVAAGREKQPGYWKNLSITAMNSRAVFLQGAVVNELSISLQAQSTLIDGGADLQHFSVQVDSTSNVSLREKSLRNIKLVK